MRGKNKLSGWVPAPKCWLQSLVLFVGLLTVTSIMYLTGRLLAGPIEIITELPPAKVLVLPIFWAGIFWGFILPIFIFAHIYQFFWGKYSRNLPWWIPNHDSISEGGWHFAITLLSFSLTMTIFSIFDPGFLDGADYGEFGEIEDGLLFALWFICVACFFHIKEKLRIPKDLPEKDRK